MNTRITGRRITRTRITGRRGRRLLGLVAALAALGALAAPLTSTPIARASGSALVPVVPGRLLDTRPGEPTVDGQHAGDGMLAAAGVVRLQVAGRHGVPADAQAVMLNVTAVTPEAAGYLTVWPCGAPLPGTSSVNYQAGQVVPNAVLSQIGADGQVCILSLSATHVLADVTGFVPAGGGVATVVPGRLLDTRPGEPTVDGQQGGAGMLGAGQVVELQVAGRHGIPGDAAAVMLNVTAVTPESAGYLTVWPCGAPQPGTSSVNYQAGQVVPNAVLSQIGAGGRVCVFTLAGSHVVADVTGFVPAGGAVSTLVPGRLLDTRPGEPTVDGQHGGAGMLGAGQVVELQVAGRHGIPGGAAAVMLNVTAVTPDAAGFLTVWPCGAPQPGTSSVNYQAGQVVPNAVLSQVGAGGKVCIFTLSAAHVLADVTAYVPDGGTGGTGGGGTGGGTGGGGTGGGGTGGGGTGGGGTGGGGTGTPAATFVKPAFAGQNVTIGPDGTAHLVYTDQWGERGWYASCSAGCSSTDAWTHTQLVTIDTDATSGAGTGGVAVDASGRVHALFDGWGFDGWSLLYATCAASCGSQANWTFTDLTEGSTPTSADATTVLMVEPDGSVAFVAAGFDDNVDWQVKYYECDAACASAANWTVSGAFLGYPVAAVRDPAGTSHVVFHPSNVDSDQLRYARCAAACSDPASWVVAAGAFDAFAGASLAVTDSGRVYIGRLQGELGNADDRRYLVSTCAGGCADLATWTTYAVGDDWEGWDGATLETSGEQVLLVTTAGDQLRGRLCEAACYTAGAYGATIVIDHNEAVGEVVNPMLHAETDLCSSADPNWWTQNPVAAMTADRLLVMHNPYGTYVCYPDNVIYDLASIGRALADF